MGDFNKLKKDPERLAKHNLKRREYRQHLKLQPDYEEKKRLELEKRKQKYKKNKDVQERTKAKQLKYYNERKNDPEFKEKQKQARLRHKNKINSNPLLKAANEARRVDYQRKWIKRNGGQIGPDRLRKTVPTKLIEVKRALSFDFKMGSDFTHLTDYYEPSESYDYLYELICDHSEDSDVQQYFEDYFNLYLSFKTGKTYT